MLRKVFHLDDETDKFYYLAVVILYVFGGAVAISIDWIGSNIGGLTGDLITLLGYILLAVLWWMLARATVQLLWKHWHDVFPS